MLMRRLPLVILAVLVAVLTGIGAWLLVPPIQQSTAAVLFVPSVKQPGVEGPTNPLLSLGTSVSIVASVVQIAVSNDQTMATLAENGHTGKYEVLSDLSSNAGPVLLVTVEDSSFAQAQATRDALVEQIAKALQLLQAQQRVPEDLRVNTVLLTSSVEPTAIHKTQAQVASVGAAAMLVALLLLIIELERRKQRHVELHDHQHQQQHAEPAETESETPLAWAESHRS
jgi:hypothetical protein